MKTKNLIILLTLMGIILSCQRNEKPSAGEKKNEFGFLAEKFADLKIMRYQVPGFEELNADRKALVYYLSEAALAGRDIIFDQNYKYNLAVRRTLEEIYGHYQGDRQTPEWEEFMVYLKRKSIVRYWRQTPLKPLLTIILKLARSEQQLFKTCLLFRKVPRFASFVISR